MEDKIVQNQAQRENSKNNGKEKLEAEKWEELKTAYKVFTCSTTKIQRL
jgi:hypothetical protein